MALAGQVVALDDLHGPGVKPRSAIGLTERR